MELVPPRRLAHPQQQCREKNRPTCRSRSPSFVVTTERTESRFSSAGHKGIVMQSGYALREIAPPRVRAFVPETSDEALIGLIADGDKRAMQVLYGRHNVRVYRFIVRLTGNASLAEDLVSEVFLDVWRQADGF